MAKKYKVVHESLGQIGKDTEVTEEDLVAEGISAEDALRVGAVVEVDERGNPIVPAKEAPKMLDRAPRVADTSALEARITALETAVADLQKLAAKGKSAQ